MALSNNRVYTLSINCGRSVLLDVVVRVVLVSVVLEEVLVLVPVVVVVLIRVLFTNASSATITTSNKSQKRYYYNYYNSLTLNTPWDRIPIFFIYYDLMMQSSSSPHGAPDFQRTVCFRLYGWPSRSLLLVELLVP